jgi:hypothetical protein
MLSYLHFFFCQRLSSENRLNPKLSIPEMKTYSEYYNIFIPEF